MLIKVVEDEFCSYFEAENVEVFTDRVKRGVTIFGEDPDNESLRKEMEIDLCSVHVHLKKDGKKKCYLYEIHKDIDSLQLGVDTSPSVEVIEDLLINGISVLSS